MSDEYLDCLNAEQYVDIDKLKSLAKHGIPPSIRGEVWLYLTGVLSPDRTNEITLVRSKYAAYAAMDKSPLSNRVRLECTRYFDRRIVPYLRKRAMHHHQQHHLSPSAAPNMNSSTNTAVSTSTAANAAAAAAAAAAVAIKEEQIDVMTFSTSCENVLSAYLHGRGLDYKTGMVQLVAPFVLTLKTEAGQFYCFERLMTVLNDESTNGPLASRLSHFLSLLRHFLPDLHNYFEEEEVDLREIATAWLSGLFSREMEPGTLMRVWDLYFATDDPLELHNYMCLAILSTLKETLEELDQSEIRSVLLHLPALDVDRLTAEAQNMRSSYRQLQTRNNGGRNADLA